MKAKQKKSLLKEQRPPDNQIAASDPTPRPSIVKDIIIVLAVAWAVRLAFMIFIPSQARSFDAFSWESTAKLLESGVNPYQATPLLNWPPFWLQIIFCISKVATMLGAPFFRVLQSFLILAESGVIIFLIILIREVVPTAPVRKIVIIGLALNPIAILLICQHCNFDVLVGFWLLLFMISLLRYNRDNNPGNWLAACLFLGLGILTKTVPLLLIPMLAGGFRRATGLFKFLGAALLLGPVTLGMSVIYALSPADVTSKVLLYRSIGGYFGFSGFIHMAGADQYSGIFNILFYVFLLTVMALSWNLFWRRHNIGNRETVVYAAVLLAAIPALGPGYTTEYIYWFMPLLVATYAFYEGRWRAVLIGFAIIAACTYLVEYGLETAFGCNLLVILTKLNHTAQVQSLLPIITKLSSQTGQTLFRIPLFLGYLILLVFGARVLLRNIPNLRITKIQVGYYSTAVVLMLGVIFGVKYLHSDAHEVGVLKTNAEKGVAQAQLQLAIRYLSGQGVEANPTNAFDWFYKAANQGLAEAQSQLGVCYATGNGTAQNLDAAVSWFRKAADQGDVDAEYNLGLSYDKGLGVQQNIDEAAIWYERAAAKGHVLAQNNLGLICFDRRKDYIEAAQWFQRAAAQGFAPAQNSLGVLYIQGLGTKKDVNEASRWFQQSAEQGYAEGENNYGLLMFAAQRYGEAGQWFEKAADQGLAAAQQNLAQMYQNGVGFSRDLGEALLWYTRAANQGNGQALFALGKLYYDGQGVKADHVEAYKFFKLAGLAGIPDAESALTNCAATMSQEQINDAENEVKQFPQ
ncbi:MAG TPA: hypothetical protein VMB22_07810 [Verrucomicrobiae bacterium]|nr:hypothetical protein [Verrucomicrobiae bacterium]